MDFKKILIGISRVYLSDDVLPIQWDIDFSAGLGGDFHGGIAMGHNASDCTEVYRDRCDCLDRS